MVLRLTLKILIVSLAFVANATIAYALDQRLPQQVAYLSPCEALGVSCPGGEIPTTQPPAADPPPRPSGGGRRLPRVPDAEQPTPPDAAPVLHDAAPLLMPPVHAAAPAAVPEVRDLPPTGPGTHVAVLLFLVSSSVTIALRRIISYT